MEDHARLETLHARLRRQQRTTVAALAVALAALALAASATARDDGARPPGELRARRYVLVDEDGRTAGRWEAEAGRAVFLLQAPAGAAAGRAPAVRLEASAVHGPVLEASGPRGRLRYAERRTGPGLELDAGAAHVDLRCIDGRPYLGMLGGGPGQLDLWPDSLGVGGVHVFGLRDDAFAPGLHIADPAGGRTAHVGLDGDHRLVARSLDADGRETHRHDLEPAR